MRRGQWSALFLFAAAAQTAAPDLNDLIRKSYVELVDLAPQLEIPRKTIDDYRKQLEIRKKEDMDGLEAEKKHLQAQSDEIRKQLDEINRSASADDTAMAARRGELHCKLLKIERDQHEIKTERAISVPVDYDHRLTKLEILAQWPAKKKEVAQAIAAGKGRARRWGDIDDIGFRKIGVGQEGDVKLGEDAVAELRSYRLLPPEVESRPLRDYIQELGERIAAASDLKVPLRTAVLDTAEINAFGLPGGHLFVDAGMIQRAGSEDELAGVLAHEIAHIAARHGEKLTKPTGSVPRMLLQGATMAADAFTGGAVGQARSAAHDYLGLGVHLNLPLLGVSRETEGEAGQLCTQYLWKAGYDPAGFVRFYDSMASDKDHAATASFFRTHPPAIDRAITTLAELEYLPKKTQASVASDKFAQAKTMAESWLKNRSADRFRAAVRPECGTEASPR